MKKEFCLLSKKMADAINDRKTVILPINIKELFGVKYCQEKHKQMIYYNKINNFTIKRVYVRILSLIVNFIFDLSIKGKIIINHNDKRIYKDLLNLIKNSGIGNFIMENCEYYYFNLDIVENEYHFDIYCNVSGVLKNERFFIGWLPIQKLNRLNGLKHKAVIIDELPKIEFDYKKIIEQTKKVMAK